MYISNKIKKFLATGMIFALSVSLCEAEIPVDAAIQPIQLNVKTRYYRDGDGDGDLLWSSKTLVNMVGSGKEKGVAALQDSLWEYNKRANEEYKAVRDKMLKNAKAEKELRRADGSFFFGPYENLTDVYVRRADTNVTSLLEFYHSYEGGVHGMYAVFGRNFDSKTGRELELTDVFTDANMLVGAIEAQLRRDYPNASFMTDGDKLMERMVEHMILEDKISWSLDPCGATFYFNPYMIGSYAEGIFNATILFDDYPGLFREKYAAMPAVYCMELFPYLPVRTCFADGSSTAITVGGTDSGIRVEAGGEQLFDSGYSGIIRPILVSMADGRRYIYVDTVEEGESWECTRAYDITNGVPTIVPQKSWVSRRADVPENYKEAVNNKNREKNFYVMSDVNDIWMTLFDEKGGQATKTSFKIGQGGGLLLKQQ
ncbi:DUF3298 and DUF4163 domain-containing protein [uncultured Anaerovibrio sp.]|uniref:DUF3298 and DUF4163 domain-containing protein n=1 Tax=uncultured Anaerovibrio sp. TaxID=361586 RepID=UPI00262E1FAF|nr:DUF3298 and DUF4163 domain-containing protein [uncultured Anaerovibrio sp.]